MGTKILKTVIISLIILSYLQAETIELSLEKAIEIAEKNNPSIKIAKEGIKRAKTQITEAKAGLLPTLNAFTSLDHAWDLQKNKIPNFLKPSLAPTYNAIGNTMIAIGTSMDDQQLIQEGQGMIDVIDIMPDYMEMAFGLENTVVYGMKLDQPLFTGGIIWNGYKISQMGYGIAQKQLELARQTLLDNVTQTYYYVQFAKSTKEVSEKSLHSAQENLDQVQKFFNSGKASKLDLLRAEVQVANLKPSVISAENGLKMVKSRFAIMLGLQNGTDIILTDDLKYNDSPLNKMTLDELTELAFQSRPEVFIFNQQQQIANRQLKMSKGSLLPMVSLGTTYQYMGMRNDLNFNNDDFNKSFNTSLSLSIPLFSGFKKSAQIQQAKIATKELKFQKRTALDGIRMEVEQAYFLILESTKKVETQGKTIEQAEEALRLAQLMYSEGACTQLDVLNSNLSLMQAEMNYQQSLLEYNNALSGLKKAVNKQ